jgi:iron uptake system EfeUOB component EfeO/EfeM
MKEEVDKIYSKVVLIHYDFPKLYKKWVTKYKSSLDNIKPLHVNQRYKTLLRVMSFDELNKKKQEKPKGRSVDDYNKYVDEVLKLTPHNQIFTVPLSHKFIEG